MTARYKRTYKVDRATGKVIPLDQSPEDAAVCEAIAASTNPYKRDLFSDDSVPGKTRKFIAKWPIVSDAMGVDPDEVPRAQAILRERGVSTEYDREGRPILRDRTHRRLHAEALGFVDRDAGYSDPC